MNKIRVLLVDDASAVRRLVAGALNRDPALEVVGTAADGEVALRRVAELCPDVVILDVEMPVMDGLQTLEELRKAHPRLPVIMFSRHTQRGVEATVRALTLGADDYVPKPGDGLEASRCIEKLLIPKIKLLSHRGHRGAVAEHHPAGPVRPTSRPSTAERRVELIVIAASTGGPNALAELFPTFAADWPVPIVIAQHMPPVFTARLAERLAEKSNLNVREGVAGEPLSAAQAWVAPGDFHLVVRRDGSALRLATHQGPAVNSCRPSADVLFQSAAEACGAGVLAVVLTGMGQDGLAGCQSVRSAGGQVLAQDEASSVVWSMPGAVARAGLADDVLSLDRIGPEIVSRVRRGRTTKGGRG